MCAFVWVICFNYCYRLRTAAVPFWRKSLEISRKRLPGVCSPLSSFKAIYQGDGLEIVRFSLSVGGWELPSGRNAKGCLEAVRATAGEYLVNKASEIK